MTPTQLDQITQLATILPDGIGSRSEAAIAIVERAPAVLSILSDVRMAPPGWGVVRDIDRIIADAEAATARSLPL